MTVGSNVCLCTLHAWYLSRGEVSGWNHHLVPAIAMELIIEPGYEYAEGVKELEDKEDRRQEDEVACSHQRTPLLPLQTPTPTPPTPNVPLPSPHLSGFKWFVRIPGGASATVVVVADSSSSCSCRQRTSAFDCGLGFFSRIRSETIAGATSGEDQSDNNLP